MTEPLHSETTGFKITGGPDYPFIDPDKLTWKTDSIKTPVAQSINKKRGSIALARSLCYQINGAADDSDDMDGGGYGSVEVAEILSAEIERLREALAQQEQEPVAYYHPRNGFYWAKPTSIFAPTVVDVPPMPLYVKWKAAQRPWQGLTERST